MSLTSTSYRDCMPRQDPDPDHAWPDDLDALRLSRDFTLAMIEEFGREIREVEHDLDELVLTGGQRRRLTAQIDTLREHRDDLVVDLVAIRAQIDAHKHAPEICP